MTFKRQLLISPADMEAWKKIIKKVLKLKPKPRFKEVLMAGQFHKKVRAGKCRKGKR